MRRERGAGGGAPEVWVSGRPEGSGQWLGLSLRPEWLGLVVEGGRAREGATPVPLTALDVEGGIIEEQGGSSGHPTYGWAQWKKQSELCFC